MAATGPEIVFGTIGFSNREKEGPPVTRKTLHLCHGLLPSCTALMFRLVVTKHFHTMFLQYISNAGAGRARWIEMTMIIQPIGYLDRVNAAIKITQHRSWSTRTTAWQLHWNPVNWIIISLFKCLTHIFAPFKKDARRRHYFCSIWFCSSVSSGSSVVMSFRNSSSQSLIFADTGRPQRTMFFNIDTHS